MAVALGGRMDRLERLVEELGVRANKTDQRFISLENKMEILGSQIKGLMEPCGSQVVDATQCTSASGGLATGAEKDDEEKTFWIGKI